MDFRDSTDLLDECRKHFAALTVNDATLVLPAAWTNFVKQYKTNVYMKCVKH